MGVEVCPWTPGSNRRKERQRRMAHAHIKTTRRVTMPDPARFVANASSMVKTFFGRYSLSRSGLSLKLFGRSYEGRYKQSYPATVSGTGQVIINLLHLTHAGVDQETLNIADCGHVDPATLWPIFKVL